MKTFLKTTTIAAAVALASTSALANDINVEVTGEVEDVCTLTTTGGNPVDSVENVDLNDTSDQNLGRLIYTCNSGNGFTRTATSTNGGTLNGESFGQTIDYDLVFTGEPGLYQKGQPTPNLTKIFAADAGFVAGKTGQVKVNIPSLPAGLYADTYSDDVTIAITAN